VAKLPKGSDPAELAQRDPEELRQKITNAVPFLRFRLDRVLEGANMATAEGKARAAELAMEVLAETPQPNWFAISTFRTWSVASVSTQNMLRARVLHLADESSREGRA